MANDTTRNPWSVDTASATSLIAAGPADPPREVRIRNIQWINPTVAGHEAIVADGYGRTIWLRVAAAIRENIESEFQGIRGRQIYGLRVPTLGSGTLYITFFQDGGS